MSKENNVNIESIEDSVVIALVHDDSAFKDSAFNVDYCINTDTVSVYDEYDRDVSDYDNSAFKQAFKRELLTSIIDCDNLASFTFTA